MIKIKRRREISETKYRKLKELYLLGISIRKTASVVKVNKNTVERYFKRFSYAIIRCVEKETIEISGEVEVDESYFGGHRKRSRCRGASGKIAVIGAIFRKGKVQAQIIEQADVNTINTFICNTIDKGSIIFTDSFRGYNKVYKYEKINHSKYFVKAKNIHTNTIESFWAYAKKCFRLTHGGVKKYFSRFPAKILFTLNHSSFIIQMKLLNKYLLLSNYVEHSLVFYKYYHVRIY